MMTTWLAAMYVCLYPLVIGGANYYYYYYYYYYLLLLPLLLLPLLCR